MANAFPEFAKKRFAAGIRVDDITAAVVYVCLAGLLYFPTPGLRRVQLLYALNAVAAAWGGYFLSKRWVSNRTPSIIAGGVYGFGPFALSFASPNFHPLAGLAIAMVPWLLLPSVYWHKGKNPDAVRFCVRAILSLLPFAGIVLLFWMSVQSWTGPVFLMPKELALTVKDFPNLILPLRHSGGDAVFGLYHGSLVCAIMGILVLIKLQRIALLIPIAAGVILSVWEPLFQVSPIVWAAFPILFLSVLCGLGFQALLCAGKADAKWVVICAAAASALAAFCAGIMITPFAGRVFELSAAMYALAAVALWILLALVRLNLRWPWFKWAVLTTAVTIDLLYSARYLIDKF